MKEDDTYTKARKLWYNPLFRLYCYVQPRFWKARKAFADRRKPGADYSALVRRAWELTGTPLGTNCYGTASQIAMRWLARGRN